MTALHCKTETITTIFNGQQFHRISYGKGEQCWYPTDNLIWLIKALKQKGLPQFKLVKPGQFQP